MVAGPLAPAEEGAPTPVPQPAQASDAPTSSKSVVGHIREAQRSSTGMVNFMQVLLQPAGVVLGCLLGCTILLVLLALTYGLAITMIVVGSLFKDDCPIESGIPIWLIVGGSVQLVISLCWPGDHRNDCMSALFSLFYLSWFIAGCVLIYPNFPPSYHRPSASKSGSPHASKSGQAGYCDRTLFITSFVIIIIYSCVLGMLIMSFLTFACIQLTFKYCRKNKEDSGSTATGRHTMAELA